MHLKRQIIRYLSWTKKQPMLVVAVCLCVFVLTLPWTEILPGEMNAEVLGIPVLFLASLIMLPVAAGLLFSMFLDTAEDNDRHDQRFEN